jgi:hypothetical protein
MTDTQAQVQVLPDGSPAAIGVQIDASRIYYLAMAHRAPVQRVTITNLSDADVGEVVVTCRIESAAGSSLLGAEAVELPAPRPGMSSSITRFRLQPNRRALALLEERLPAEIVVTVQSGQRLLGEQRAPFEFLAHNQWMHLPQYWDSLSAFVQPNSPAIDQVLSATRQLLLERTGSASTEGYQAVDAGDFDRVHQMAAAAFDAMRGLGIEYTNPPPSFEGNGQKVRTPDIVLREKAATCLDSAVLYSSALARMGLHPHIVMVHGHALTAYETGAVLTEHSLDATTRRALDAPVIQDINAVMAFAESGGLQPVETTQFTVTHSASFADACREGLARSFRNPSALAALVDVRRSIQAGVVPLPSANAVAAGEAEEGPTWLDGIDATEPATEGAATDYSDRERLANEAPPRVRNWLRSLLDLTYRNPLLRMPTGGRSNRALVLDLPPGGAAAVEDRLMGGQSIRIVPATAAPSAMRSESADATRYVAHLRDRGEVYLPSLGDLGAQLDAAAEAITEQFPDIPAGQLEVRAERLCEEVFSDLVSKALRSLKRKADDVERQTGANNLFLCIGLLTWTGKDGKDGSAPLFLIPVRISGTARAGFSIAVDESAEVLPNYALLERMRMDYGISVDVLERPILDDAGIDVDALLAGVRSTLIDAHVSDAVVTDAVSLAVLDFSSFRLWRDLKESWPAFMKSPVVAHLVNTPSSDFDDPNAEVEDPSDLPCPLPADESQMAAVAAAVAGKTFVLEGPPGTGKSQTITNLLAASIASGKKVLFVAEKSAALEVVRKRLAEVGLGPLCLELFDKEAKPDHIRSQIKASLDLLPPDVAAEWEALATRLATEGRRLEEYRSAVHSPGPTGTSIWEARQELLRLGDGPSFDIPIEALSSLASQMNSVVEALLDLPRIVGGDVIAAGPWALCANATAADSTDQLLNVLQWLESSRVVLAALPEPLIELLRTVSDPNDFTQAAESIRHVAAAGSLTTADLAAIDTPDWCAHRDAALARGDAFVASVTPLLQQFRPSVLTDDLTSVLHAGHEALTAGALSRKKAERAFVAASLPYRLDQSERPTADVVAWLQQASTLRAEWSTAHQVVTTLPGLHLPPTWTLLDPTAMDQVRQHASWLPTVAAAARSPWGHAVTADAALHASSAQITQALETAGTAWQQLIALLGVDGDSATRWLRGRSMWDAWNADAPAWNGDAPRFIDLQRWCELLAATEPLRTAGLGGVAAMLLDGHAPLDDAEERLRRGIALQTMLDQLATVRLDRFDSRSHSRTLEDYQTHHDQRRSLTTQQIPAEMVERRPVPKGRRIGKWGELDRSLAAQRKKLPIRRLMEEYGRYVGDLTPCFLMSPDSVARFLPPESIEFDLVVFDEASQIEVPRAIGALGRAKAAIIVGDTRQMPPSRFGNTGAGEEDDGSLDTVIDLESLLDECKESRLPTLTLQCHYRSRDEALIAFSNHHFYDDQLTTFPAPAQPGQSSVTWRRVQGRFRRSGMRLPEGMSPEDWPTGTNRIEADEVVSEILRRIDEFDRRQMAGAEPAEAIGPSIGVVTSNIQQRDLIRDLLEQSGNERVRELLDLTTADGLLVQNLENVQGDERDLMILSIGFSAQPAGSENGPSTRQRVPMNFGPLNQKGGERRLNVAVTRAREEGLVFCSFDPDDMTVAPESPAGIRLLQSYLAAARDGAERAGDIVGRTPTPPDHHRAEIAAALRARGWDVVEDVGLSKFRVDLCVGSPTESRPSPRLPRHSVAVLLDGPRWAAGATVFDRDLLPRSILTAMGWHDVVRIWLPSWLYDREEVIESIEAAVRAAEAKALATLAEVPPPIPTTLDIPVAASLENLALPTLRSARSSNAPAAEGNRPAEPIATASAPVAPPPAEAVSDDPLTIFGDVPTYGADLHVVGAGTKDWLDRLSEPAAADRVRNVMLQLADQLGPIDVDELCRSTARVFGLSRVRADRITAIRSLIPPSATRTASEFGDFVWPSGVDPSTWRGFRRNDGELARKVTEMAPEEVLNAMRVCVHVGQAVSMRELVELTARLFGHDRLTSAVRERLEALLNFGVESGALGDLGNDTFGPGTP